MTMPKGFIRSAAAASRRAEPEHQRQLREAARRYKQQLRLRELPDADQAVQDYNSYISILKSLHRHVSDTLDWNAIIAEPEPQEPARYQVHELHAHVQLEQYKPSFLDKLLKKQQRKILKLRQEIIYARVKDQRRYESSLVSYLQAKQQWIHMQQMADGILSADPEAYEEAITFFHPFAAFRELGAEVELQLTEDRLTACFRPHNEEVVPGYILSLKSAGHLSKKEMATSRLHELYRDYICSGVLRLAREVFAHLPLDMLMVQVRVPAANNISGRMEERTVLSAAICGETLNRLQPDTTDPFEALQQFVHHMHFSKIDGFSAVEEVRPGELVRI